MVSGVLTPIFNSNYVMLNTDSFIIYETLITTQIVTLAMANSVSSRYYVVIGDGSGNCSPAISIIIKSEGLDQIGNRSSILITSAYTVIKLASDGISRWYLG